MPYASQLSIHFKGKSVVKLNYEGLYFQMYYWEESKILRKSLEPSRTWTHGLLITTARLYRWATSPELSRIWTYDLFIARHGSTELQQLHINSSFDLDRELRSRGHLSPHPRPREVSSGQLRGRQGRQLVGAAQGHFPTVQLSNRPPHNLLLLTHRCDDFLPTMVSDKNMQSCVACVTKVGR